WKFSENDLRTRTQWPAYQEAYADVFARTSTDHAPWFVIPSDRKWYARAAILEILTRTMVEMDLGWPQPAWSPADMRAELAKLMTAEALETSLADTEESVTSALAEDAEVARSSIRVQRGQNPAKDSIDQAEKRAALARVNADKAAWLAELAHTREQKRHLVEEARAREMLTDPSEA
ncbi:MAG: hypothetical protein Q4F67_09085, partial [Propionibacteriaceae bacterium]|nr:hypothetical protein [Propionibacteriaceae bacterium]